MNVKMATVHNGNVSNDEQRKLLTVQITKKTDDLFLFSAYHIQVTACLGGLPYPFRMSSATNLSGQHGRENNRQDPKSQLSLPKGDSSEKGKRELLMSLPTTRGSRRSKKAMLITVCATCHGRQRL